MTTQEHTHDSAMSGELKITGGEVGGSPEPGRIFIHELGVFQGEEYMQLKVGEVFTKEHSDKLMTYIKWFVEKERSLAYEEGFNKGYNDAIEDNRNYKTLKAEAQQEILDRVYTELENPSFAGVLDGNEKRRGYMIAMDEVKEILSTLKDKSI